MALKISEKEKFQQIRTKLPSWYRVRIRRVKLKHPENPGWINGYMTAWGAPTICICIPAEKYMTDWHWSVAASFLLHEAGHLLGTDYERKAWSNAKKLMKKFKVSPAAFKPTMAACLKNYRQHDPTWL